MPDPCDSPYLVAGWRGRVLELLVMVLSIAAPLAILIAAGIGEPIDELQGTDAQALAAGVLALAVTFFPALWLYAGGRALVAWMVTGKVELIRADAVRDGTRSVEDAVAFALAGPAASMVGLALAQRLAPLVTALPLRLVISMFEMTCLLCVCNLLPYRFQWTRRDRLRSSDGALIIDALRAGRRR
jgi:hypothetical protein